MAQVFISYRHVEPDQSLAAELANAVGKEHRVFIDNQIPLGRQWGDIIREHLEDADFLTALVSQNSAKSPMVLAEIEQARQLNVAKERPGIIPIRLNDVPSRSPNRFTMTVATTFCLWKRRLYLVEISAGQGFGERQGSKLLGKTPNGNGNRPNHRLRRLERRAVTIS